MTASEGNSGDPHVANGASSEPKTPMWLTALGAVLFLTVGLLWGLSTPSKDASPPSEPTAASAASAGAADGGAAAPGH
jgi:hypothetical protein